MIANKIVKRVTKEALQNQSHNGGRHSSVDPASCSNPKHDMYAFQLTSGQSYKHFTIVINDPRVVTWAIS